MSRAHSLLRTARRPRVLVRLATFAVFALAGVLLATSALTARGTDLRAARTADLDSLLRARSYELARLQQQVEDATARVAQLGARQEPESTRLQERLAALSPTAGLTAVRGPGVRVTLDDAPYGTSGGSLVGNPTPDDLVVHQQDVQAVVNAMWRAGASGVSVMGQRLVATSAVRCVGNTLLLGGRVYSPPYRIEAVGDPDRITRALDRDPQLMVYREYVDLYGLGYDVDTEPRLTLEPYAGALPQGSATR